MHVKYVTKEDISGYFLLVLLVFLSGGGFLQILLFYDSPQFTYKNKNKMHGKNNNKI